MTTTTIRLYFYDGFRIVVLLLIISIFINQPSRKYLETIFNDNFNDKFNIDKNQKNEIYSNSKDFSFLAPLQDLTQVWYADEFSFFL